MEETKQMAFYKFPTEPQLFRSKPVPYLDRLKQRKEQLEGDLAEVNKAIEGMEAHPEVVKVLDLIQSVL